MAAANLNTPVHILKDVLIKFDLNHKVDRQKKLGYVTLMQITGYFKCSLVFRCKCHF